MLGGIVLVLGAVVLFGRSASCIRPSAPRLCSRIPSAACPSARRSPSAACGSAPWETIALQFDPKTHTAYIPVTVQLNPDSVRVSQGGDSNAVDLSQMVERGLRAELNTQSFVTGQSEIDLDFDTSSPAVLHPGVTNLPEIPTRQSTIQKVREQLSQLPLRELADNAGATLQSLRELSQKLNTSLPPLIESARTTSDKSGQAVDTAAQAIKDLQARLDVTLDAVNRLAATGDTQLTQRGADLHTLLASSTQTIVQARETLNDLKGLTSSRAADRANIDSTLRDLAAAAASLRGFATTFEHNPQLLLTGRRP